MYCDDCPERARCEDRESFIVGDQFELCAETGKPDWRPDDHFFDFPIEPVGENNLMEVEEDMNKNGTCSNCERGNLNLVGDLCHTCYSAAKEKTGEDRVQALQAVADRIKAGKIRPNWKKATQVKADIANQGKIEELEGRSENDLKSGPITLELDRYPDIKSAIEIEANKEFRTIDMQILYLLRLHIEEKKTC